MRLKARVRNGRLVLDEPTELPEGTEVDLLALDPGDRLDPADRAALHEALLLINHERVEQWLDSLATSSPEPPPRLR